MYNINSGIILKFRRAERRRFFSLGRQTVRAGDKSPLSRFSLKTGAGRCCARSFLFLRRFIPAVCLKGRSICHSYIQKKRRPHAPPLFLRFFWPFSCCFRPPSRLSKPGMSAPARIAPSASSQPPSAGSRPRFALRLRSRLPPPRRRRMCAAGCLCLAFTAFLPSARGSDSISD